MRFFLFSISSLAFLFLCGFCARFNSQPGYLGLTLLGGDTGGSAAATATPTETAAEINLQQGGTDLPGGSGSHDFGSILNDGDGGTTSGAITFTIQNTGTADLNIASVSVTAGDTTEFDIDTSGVSSPVAASGTTTFTLIFDPTATAAASATVTIANDDADEGTYTFTITGTGTPATSKRIFITAAQYQGNIGDTTTADTNCVNDANNPAGAGTGTWKAMLAYGDGSRTACATANCGGGAGENSDWVFAPLTTYTRGDGTTIVFTTDASGVFTFGTLTNSFSASGDTVWTGLSADWTTDGNHCTNWTVGTGAGNQGERGIATGTDSTSISAGGGSPQCNQNRKTVCVEQ